LRIMLALVLLVAALLALSAQRQGSGALIAQSAYIVALILLIIDRVMMIRKERMTNGRAVVQIAVGVLIASLLFSPDFANAVQKKRPGLELNQIVKLAESSDRNARVMALEICLLRRGFKVCKNAFKQAALSDDPLIQALGKSGLRGRSGIRR
jgi:hypothetical protein